MGPVILVAGGAGAGATTVAVGLAHRIAYAGHEVRLARLAGDDRAESDAETFASLEFADVVELPLEGDAGDGVVVVEAPAGADAAALASQLGAKLVAVARADREDEVPASAALTIRTHARSADVLQLPEDRLLAAPTVGQLINASRARVLTRSVEGESAVCEHIVVGAIASDAAEPYFQRYGRSAIVTRAEKVDVALAALRTDPVALVLSGGADPSPYILDRVASTRTTTLLLAPEGTVETVRDIEGSFGRTPFGHEAKVERIGELMADALDDATLKGLLGS